MHKSERKRTVVSFMGYWKKRVNNELKRKSKGEETLRGKEVNNNKE